MSKFKIDFHFPGGVVVTCDFRTEEKYLAVRSFMKEMADGPIVADPDPNEVDFIYFETEQQRDAVFAFLRAWRKTSEN